VGSPRQCFGQWREEASRLGLDKWPNRMSPLGLGYVRTLTQPGSFATETGNPSRVRSTPVSNRTTDNAGGPVRADTVAKLPKCRAINFPQMDQTSRNRRPMSPPGHYRSRLWVHRRTCSPSNDYSIAARTARKICVGRRKKTFATVSAKGRLRLTSQLR
jgi:hypothetical protein